MVNRTIRSRDRRIKHKTSQIHHHKQNNKNMATVQRSLVQQQIDYSEDTEWCLCFKVESKEIKTQWTLTRENAKLFFKRGDKPRSLLETAAKEGKFPEYGIQCYFSKFPARISAFIAETHLILQTGREHHLEQLYSRYKIPIKDSQQIAQDILDFVCGKLVPAKEE